jgi:hypothetical protein
MSLITTYQKIKTYLLNRGQEKQHDSSKHDHWKHYTIQELF